MNPSLTAGVALGRLVGAGARLRGGGATSLPGKVLLRACPGGVGALGRRLPEGNVLLSATNGKTTTSALAAGILRRAGHRLVHNHSGANMAGGIASTLLAASRSRGRMTGELGLFEVDEFWLEQLSDALSPRAIVLSNLFRDQLDRYGELDTIAERWAALAARTSATLVLGADDPLIADLGRGLEREPLWFGIEDDRIALPRLSHASDSAHCRRCGHPYHYEAIYLGHLGRYRCPNCGQGRPRPAVYARDVVLEGVRASRFELVTPAGAATVQLPLPGLYNLCNALAAAALAHQLGVALEVIVAGLQDTAPAFGRGETLIADGRELRILLVKNPAGANEVLRTLALEPGEHDLLVVLNDQIADGRDVSWVWDADFETLAGRLRRVTCSGTRAAELALRLKYAGVPEDRITMIGELRPALEHALADRPPAAAPLYALPTYTAMLALRELLVARGEARSSWT
ncbi:MAG TPA: Mur ligase family protein [Solirubrobacteraceae bacterium]|jgi:UDP-N-acetylmuramyl tripeptide synthase|nr:Mur ligase family protein [Solirubrobacteraceae bacterium]